MRHPLILTAFLLVLSLLKKLKISLRNRIFEQKFFKIFFEKFFGKFFLVEISTRKIFRGQDPFWSKTQGFLVIC